MRKFRKYPIIDLFETNGNNNFFKKYISMICRFCYARTYITMLKLEMLNDILSIDNYKIIVLYLNNLFKKFQ